SGPTGNVICGRIGWFAPLAVVQVVPSVVAPTASFSSMGAGPTGLAETIGWQFTPTSDIAVTHLGFYDSGMDGFVESHTIGIFSTATQQLVASITLPAGTGAQPLNSFGVTGFLATQSRGQAITPVVLTAGQTYTIAATQANEFWYRGGSMGVDPRIGY